MMYICIDPFVPSSKTLNGYDTVMTSGPDATGDEPCSSLTAGMVHWTVATFVPEVPMIAPVADICSPIVVPARYAAWNVVEA